MAFPVICRTEFTDNRETLEAALNSILNGKPEDTEQDLSKLFTPTFTMRNNEASRDFPAFVAHHRSLREMALGISLVIVEFVRSGSHFAARQVGPTLLPNGSNGSIEAFIIGDISRDGRIDHVNEAIIRRDMAGEVVY